LECTPVLLVTCRTGHDELCMNEVGDVIFGVDDRVVVEKTGFPGLLIVYSCIGVEKAYRRAVHREYGFVENIIPVHCIISTDNIWSGLQECIESLQLPGRVKIRVRMRGVRGMSTSIFTWLIRTLGSRGIVHDSSSDKCLYVEGVRDKIYVGVGYCRTVLGGASSTS